MRILFKISGFLAVLLVCTALGFFKAFSLKARFENLNKIKLSLLKLKERLRLKSGDKNRLIRECFNTNSSEYSLLNDEDKQLLNEFFENFGKGDTAQEIERCSAYISLFDERIKQAQINFSDQQKLYKTLGFLCGILICIFFL